MPGLRKVEDERDARRCLSALSRSGETLREWARSHGVDGRSLRAWQINMARGSSRALARSTPARLVELVPVTMPSTPRRYVVRVGPGAVEVGDDFDAGTLGRIVEVLASC
jgi:hypothetical protein